MLLLFIAYCFYF